VRPNASGAQLRRPRGNRRRCPWLSDGRGGAGLADRSRAKTCRKIDQAKEKEKKDDVFLHYHGFPLGPRRTK
jgi:hypothetical protein